MREILTIIAAFVLFALALALAVPPFINWASYNAVLSARLGQALRADVHLTGPILVRLLPSPRFEVGGLTLRRSGLDLTADGASLELALAPLFRGTVTVASARLERPRMAIDAHAVLEGMSVPAEVGIEQVTLRDATFSLTTEHGTRRLDHVDLSASADGAFGPFKAEGFVRVARRLLPFRLATGAVNAGRLAIKAEVDPLAGLPRMEANGALLWNKEGPKFEGTAVLSGEIESAARDARAMPWRLRVEGVASDDVALSDAIELRLGDEGARLIATGAGRLSGDSGVTASLTSERPDFDRFTAAYDPRPVMQAIEAAGSQQAFSIDWRAQAAVLGREVVSDARASVSRRSGDASGQAHLDASLSATRDGALSFRGDVEGLNRATGAFTLRTRDAPALGRWLRALTPGGLSPIEVPIDRIDVSGQIDAGTEGIEATGVRATLDRSALVGRVAYTPARNKNAARIDATVSASALDLDALPDISQMRAAAKGLDFAVTFDAHAIRVARVGRTAVEAGRIGFAMSRSGDTLTLGRLSLDDLGGATASAKGQLTAAGGHVDLALDARQLGGLATLLRRVAPGSLSDTLGARAAAFSPATIEFRMDAAMSREGALSLTHLVVSGKGGDTQVRVNLTPAPGDADVVTGELILEAPESAPLLRQLGVPVIPLRGQGHGRVEARVSGRTGQALALNATATFAGATAVFEGTTRLDTDVPNAAGRLHVHARDLGPLLRIVAAPVDSFASWPADASARIEMGVGALMLSGIDGQIGGTSVTGVLRHDRSVPIGGALHLDRIDLSALAALLLGPPQPIAPDRAFSTLIFSPQPNDPLAMALDLAADRMGFPGGGEATNASARLTVAPGVVEAKDVRMTIAGGIASGELALKREGATASLSASLGANDVSLTRAWASSRATAHLEIAGAGESMAGLIGSLAGRGSLRLAETKMMRADPGAPARVAQAVDTEAVDLDPQTIDAALAQAFDTKPQALPILERPFFIEAGQATVAPFEVAVGTAQATLGARYDLANNRIELRETLRSAPPVDWTGPAPAVTLTFAGPIGNPLRTIEASEFIGTLAAHGLLREEERIAAIERDQRERSFFNRRLKSDRALEAARRAEEARQEAVRQEAARKEAAHQEALRQEALRREMSRQEAVRQEAARQDRERRAADRARESAAAPAGTAPLDLRPPAARSGGGVPSIIAPDPTAPGR